MRAADLVGRRVVGPDGKDLGDVVDIRVVQDGPMLGAFAALRVDGIVVGKRALSSRLGYDRTDVNGPALVNGIVQALMRHNRYLPWTEVSEVGDVIRSSRSDLQDVPRIT